jgi:hypothetical protein
MGNIIATDELVSYLGLANPEPGNIFEELISAAEQLIDDVLGYAAAQETRTFTLDGNGRTLLYSPEPFTSQPTQVNVDSGRTFASGTDLTFDTDWTWRAEAPQTLVRINSAWTRDVRNVRVVGPVGWTAAAMPRSIKLVALAESAKVVNEMKQARDGEDVLSASIVDGWHLNYLEKMALSDASRERLAQYAAIAAGGA